VLKDPKGRHSFVPFEGKQGCGHQKESPDENGRTVQMKRKRRLFRPCCGWEEKCPEKGRRRKVGSRKRKDKTAVKTFAAEKHVLRNAGQRDLRKNERP